MIRSINCANKNVFLVCRDVLDGWVDVAAAPVSVTQPRSIVVDFTFPIMTDIYSFVYRYNCKLSHKFLLQLFLSRKKLTHDWSIFLQPLHLTSWTVLLLSVVLLALALRLLVRQGEEPSSAQFSLIKELNISLTFDANNNYMPSYYNL